MHYYTGIYYFFVVENTFHLSLFINLNKLKRRAFFDLLLGKKLDCFLLRVRKKCRSEVFMFLCLDDLPHFPRFRTFENSWVLFAVLFTPLSGKANFFIMFKCFYCMKERHITCCSVTVNFIVFLLVKVLIAQWIFLPTHAIFVMNHLNVIWCFKKKRNSLKKTCRC